MENCVNETIIIPSNSSSLSHLESVNYVINNIALPAVCAFGIVGNILNLAILTRRKLQKSFRSLEQAANLCLIALAVSDLMFCVLALLTTFIPGDNVYDTKGFLYYYGLYCHFCINVFIMESTMLTVAMSLERYMAICFPLRQDLYLTTRRIKYVIVSTFIFSFAFNVPVIWRFEEKALCSNEVLSKIIDNLNTTTYSQILSKSIGLSKEGDAYESISTPKSSLLSAVLSSTVQSPLSLKADSSASSDSSHLKNGLLIASNQSSSSSTVTSPTSRIRPNQPPIRYIIQESIGNETGRTAYRIAWAIVGNVIPLILLFFFNVCLCRKIYQSYKMRKQFKRQNQAKSSSHILTLTLVVIVVMFFIFVAPSEFMLLASDTSFAIEPILNFMQSLNFSVNFILYCIISRTFRKTLKYICLCGCYNIYQVSRDWKKEFETSLM